MLAAPIPKPLPDETGRLRRAHWCLIEVARPGHSPVPFAILFADSDTDFLYIRCRRAAHLTNPEEMDELSEQETDILELLPRELEIRAREHGAAALLAALEDSLSGFFRITDRTAITYSGNPQRATDRLFDEHVDPEIRPWVTHLPLYGLRVAATRFGEGHAVDNGRPGEEEAWLRMPEGLRLAPGMFVARVVGRSMEPLIPDDSLCVFRANVTGSRKGKYVLVEKFGENDFEARYTVKRYTSEIRRAGDHRADHRADDRADHQEDDRQADREDGWDHSRIRLEPLNRSFEAFELGPDEFRVIAEFVEVLGPA